MTEPDPGWKVRMGIGLLADCPLNPELAEAHRREDEKERLDLEAEAKAREQAAFERDKELEFWGAERRTVDDVLQTASVAADRQDRRDAAAEERAAEEAGRPKPPPAYVQMLADAAAAREASAAAPATVGAVEKAIAQVKATVGNTIGRLIP